MHAGKRPYNQQLLKLIHAGKKPYTQWLLKLIHASKRTYTQQLLKLIHAGQRAYAQQLLKLIHAGKRPYTSQMLELIHADKRPDLKSTGGSPLKADLNSSLAFPPKQPQKSRSFCKRDLHFSGIIVGCKILSLAEFLSS